MKRHIVDQPRAEDGPNRTRAFLRIQRDDNPHTTTRMLQRRARSRDGEERLRTFLDLARKNASPE